MITTLQELRNKINKNMKPVIISYQSWDQKITIEKDRSDIDREELEEMLLSLITAAGWSAQKVEIHVARMDNN